MREVSMLFFHAARDCMVMSYPFCPVLFYSLGEPSSEPSASRQMCSYSAVALQLPDDIVFSSGAWLRTGGARGVLAETDGGTSRIRERSGVHPGGLGSAHSLTEHLPAATLSGVLAPPASLACTALASASGMCASSAPWSSNPVMRQTHWKCLNCKSVIPKDVRKCTTCGTDLEAMMPYMSNEEAAAVDSNAQRSAYGRKLRFSQSADQVESEAVPVAPGMPGYQDAVYGTLTTTFSTSRADRRFEPKIREGANLFDGWLAVVTSGRLRVWNRDDIHKYVNDDDAAALCTEFVLSHGRVVAVDGNADPVQVCAFALRSARLFAT